MGRKNKTYRITMDEALQRRLESMQAFGESKRKGKITGEIQEKIYSFSTYQAYKRHAGYFLEYIKSKHPECTTLKNAKKYAPEWLTKLVTDGKSAWTVSLAAKAVGKIYGITPGDTEYFTPPPRHRENIKRSRGEAVRDKHFSITNNAELIKFCQSTGLRRRELAAVKGADLLTAKAIAERIRVLENKTCCTSKEKMLLAIYKDASLFNEKYFIVVKNGKGGKMRLSPVIGTYTEQVVQRFLQTKENEKVWKHINSNADIHGYRSQYATELYKLYARDIATIPFDKTNRGSGKKYQSEVYVCRKDERGKKLDKRAMYVTSKALGHNRIDVIANHYLRGL